MNDEARQSIQTIRDKVADRVRTLLSRSDYPSPDLPFVHSHVPNTSRRQRRTPFIRQQLIDCRHFESKVRFEDRKSTTTTTTTAKK